MGGIRISALAACCLLASCTTRASDLENAQALYKDAHYERAQEWLEGLEHETPAMDPGQQARFFYLRGMTAFRLGQRDDALHYLSLAAALVQQEPTRLPDAWRPVMHRTLSEITPTDASAHARNPLRPDTL